MACTIIDDDDYALVQTTVQQAPADDRYAALEAKLEKQDRDIIGLRTLVNALALQMAGRNAAAKMKTAGEPLTAEQEAAVCSLAGCELKELAFINPVCIVGKSVCRSRYSLKVTRASLTRSKRIVRRPSGTRFSGEPQATA